MPFVLRNWGANEKYQQNFIKTLLTILFILGILARLLGERETFMRAGECLILKILGGNYE